MATTLTKQGSETTAITYSAADITGNNFLNGGQEHLHVRNAGGGAVLVTILSQRQCDQGFTHNKTVSVPAGSDRKIIAFDPIRFNDAGGKVNITYDQVTSVTVAVS